MTVKIHSSHGTITVDTSGKPVHWQMNTDDKDAVQTLLNITVFNFVEWLDFWEKDKLPGDLDILDVGYYWRKPLGEKGYEEPVEDHRNHIRAGDGAIQVKP